MHGESTQHRILVIEDDATVAEAVEAELASRDRLVQVARSGEAGAAAVPVFRPHLILLDLTLPGQDGLSVLRDLRSAGNAVPVLVLTSMNEVSDRVRGLQTGADDYLGKPFALAELGARVDALLRRGQAVEPASTLMLADLSLDLQTHKAVRAGVELVLTPREYELLTYLLQHQGRPVSRGMLSRDVWRELARFTPIDNVIDVQMTRLRRKIDDPFAVKLLHTVRGVGYVLRLPAP